MKTSHVLVLLLFCCPPLAAQVGGSRRVAVTITIIDSSSGTPVEGLAVRPTVVSGNAVRDRRHFYEPRLTNREGRVSFSLVAGERFVVSVRRIGLKPFRSLPYEVPIDAVNWSTIVSVPIVPLPLRTIAIVADPACPNDMGRIRDYFQRWDALLNALEVGTARVAAHAGEFIELRKLDLFGNSEVLDASVALTVERRGTPPVIGASSEWLTNNGFVSESAGVFSFELPSPQVLRSDAFESEHCFGEPVVADSATVTVQFRPRNDRKVPEISGYFEVSRYTDALNTVNVTYVKLDVGDDTPPTASLGFRTDSTGRTWLQQWSLTLPRGRDEFFDKRERGRRVESTKVSFGKIGTKGVGGNHLTILATKTMRLDALVSCDSLALLRCLRQGNYYWTAPNDSQLDRALASAFYHKTCSIGPSKHLRVALNSMAGDSTISLALPVTASSEELRAHLFSRGNPLHLVASQIPDGLMNEYRLALQREACARFALFPPLSEVELNPSVLLLLTATCDEGEGIACNEVARYHIASGNADAVITYANKGCRLGVADACRLLQSADSAFDPREFLIGPAALLPRGTTAQDIMKSSALKIAEERRSSGPAIAAGALDSVSNVLQADYGLRVERIKGSLLINLVPDRPELASYDEYAPASRGLLRTFGEILKGNPNIRMVAVFHSGRPLDTRSSGTFASASIARQALGRRATSWELYLSDRGARRGQFETRLLHWSEPAAPEYSGLAQQVNRRIELIIHLRE